MPSIKETFDEYTKDIQDRMDDSNTVLLHLYARARSRSEYYSLASEYDRRKREKAI